MSKSTFRAASHWRRATIRSYCVDVRWSYCHKHQKNCSYNVRTTIPVGGSKILIKCTILLFPFLAVLQMLFDILSRAPLFRPQLTFRVFVCVQHSKVYSRPPVIGFCLKYKLLKTFAPTNFKIWCDRKLIRFCENLLSFWLMEVSFSSIVSCCDSNLRDGQTPQDIFL